MNKLSSIFITILAVFVLAGASIAEAKGIKSKGRVSYDVFSDEVEERAVEVAVQGALKKYIKKNLTKAEKRMLKELEEEFYEAADDFVSEVKIIKGKDNAGKKQYTVATKVFFDPDEIKNFFITNSEAGNMGSGEGSPFGILVVGRTELARKGFDAKRADISEGDSKSIIKEESASDGTSSVDSTSTSSFSRKVTGGSTEVKSDAVVYKPNLDLTKSAEVALKSAFTDAGFEFKDVSFIARTNDMPLIGDLIKNGEMSEDGTLPEGQLIDYQVMVMDELWTFLGYAIMDAGIARNDPTTGTKVATVSMNMQVWFMEDDSPTAVAAVADQIFEDTGPDEGVARKNALKKAAESAAQTILGQLQAKQLY